MGSDANVTVRFKGQTASGKARLETEILQFRGGELKLSIPFTQMSKVCARAGALSVTWPGGIASFALGAAAAKWAGKIQHPPSRMDKLGVKPNWRASAIGIEVDVKVVGFSVTHTAEKFVIPLAKRAV